MCSHSQVKQNWADPKHGFKSSQAATSTLQPPPSSSTAPPCTHGNTLGEVLAIEVNKWHHGGIKNFLLQSFQGILFCFALFSFVQHTLALSSAEVWDTAVIPLHQQHSFICKGSTRSTHVSHARESLSTWPRVMPLPGRRFKTLGTLSSGIPSFHSSGLDLCFSLLIHPDLIILLQM